MLKSFELQVFRRREWRLNSLFESREAALAKAHDMVQCSPEFPLRVLEESFDAEGRPVATRILYESPSPEAEREQLQAHYQQALSTASPRGRTNAAAFPLLERAGAPLSLTNSQVAAMLAAGGVGLTAIFGFLWLSNIVH